MTYDLTDADELQIARAIHSMIDKGDEQKARQCLKWREQVGADRERARLLAALREPSDELINFVAERNWHPTMMPIPNGKSFAVTFLRAAADWLEANS